MSMDRMEYLERTLAKKKEAINYLVSVTNRRRRHSGAVDWTPGGRRMYNRLASEIAAINAELANG